MNKSKANLARRHKEIAQPLDRRWQLRREVPMLASGSVRYEVSGRVQRIIGCGGPGLLQELVKTVGLREAIDRRSSSSSSTSPTTSRITSSL